MTTAERPGPPSPWRPPIRRTGYETGAVTRIVHQGGSRNGTVAEIATAVLLGYLVYVGPQWFGVYEQADPPRILSTPDGPAHLWVAIDH